MMKRMERDESKPYSKAFITTPSLSHSLWVQAFHLSIDDRLTTNVTFKNKKNTYMSSGRLGNDGEPIINANNITKETKTYREFKSKKAKPQAKQAKQQEKKRSVTAEPLKSNKKLKK